MTDKTTKKTVVKASAGKQVKAAPEKAAGKGEAAAPAAAAKAAPKANAAPKAKASVSNAKADVAAAAPAAAGTATFSNAAPTSEVPADVVARKAYEIFVSEGHPHGRDQEHWFRAEAELRGVSV